MLTWFFTHSVWRWSKLRQVEWNDWRIIYSEQWLKYCWTQGNAVPAPPITEIQRSNALTFHKNARAFTTTCWRAQSWCKVPSRLSSDFLLLPMTVRIGVRQRCILSPLLFALVTVMVQTNKKKLDLIIKGGRLRWLGHILRMVSSRLPRHAI